MGIVEATPLLGGRTDTLTIRGAEVKGERFAVATKEEEDEEEEAPMADDRDVMPRTGGVADRPLCASKVIGCNGPLITDGFKRTGLNSGTENDDRLDVEFDEGRPTP